MSDIAVRSTARPPTNLVPPVSSFVGRNVELHELRQLLEAARLVTLTGPPGAGKTRLATEIAGRMLDGVEGGVWFVGLASLSDPKLILSAIAEAMGVLSATAGSPLQALTSRLRDRDTLLVLDNFEHVTTAATDVGELLGGAPTLRVLVTSRTPLHLSGEHEYTLAPLPVPTPRMPAEALARTDSVQLFGHRAVAAQPSFQVTEDNAADVIELCRRLEGLPLALELAAARVKLLPLPAIIARLDRRYALLTGGPRDLPLRQRSLRAAVAWSYDLLEPAPQDLFRRMSAFRGGWTIEGAAAVMGETPSDAQGMLETLGSLVDSSLIVRDPSGVTEPRFGMLETLREFGAERLDDADESGQVRSRHAAFYVSLAQDEAPRFTGSDPSSALNRVALEHDNIRAALTHLLEHDAAGALRLSAAMWRFWQMRGYLSEGERWLGAALEAAGPGAPDDIRVEALTALGSLAYWRGDVAGARPYYEEALAIRRNLGDELPIAAALYDLAFVFSPLFFPLPADPGRTEECARLLREAEDLYQKVGDRGGAAKTGWMRGILAMYRDMSEAEQILRESARQFRDLHDPFGLGWALRMHGCAFLGMRDTPAAGQAFREALGLFAAADDGSALGLLMGDLADLALLEGDPGKAARLKGASAGLRQLSETELANVEEVPWLAHAPPLHEMIGDAEFEAAWAEGRAMSQAEAISYALGAAAAPASEETLRVTALGSFSVERSGETLSHWGGPKAGSRQAQGMFGFLFDRGERGVTKDEFIEVIWPDAQVAQGDLNFHRTLGGLRATLEPDTPSSQRKAIGFQNGRYRLRPNVIGWDDVAEFERRLQRAALASGEQAAIRELEEARNIYRGDYLDDCPVYGDSEYVEERRTSLRGRLADALVDLAQRYERRGDATLATARFREALAVAGGEYPSATEGLERLGAVVAN